MKVIHLISGGDTGGAKTHVHSLLYNLGKTVDITLVCFLRGPFSDEAEAMGIRTLVFEGKNVFRILRQLRRLIRDEGFSIVHCHGSRGNLMGTLLRPGLGIPVISTIHSDYKLDYLGRPLAAMTYGKLNAFALRRLDYRIGVSDFMKSLLISRGFEPNSLYVIYNGLDFSRSAPASDRSAFFSRIGMDIGPENVVVGIAARLDPVKDMATLIRGFAHAYALAPQLRLVIAGTGQERETLERLAVELGVGDVICFAGWLTDMDEFYQSIDINTLTSLSETFPYAITEGAFERLPTVSTRVGGVPALVKHGETGLLFEPGDHKTLGRYLALLANDESARRRLGDAIHDKAAAEFSMDATCAKQRHVYDDVLRRYALGRKSRDGVLICGAYGHGNAGDEAILEAIIGEMRAIDPDMPLTVLSRRPDETKLHNSINAIFSFDLLQMLRAMSRSELYLNGGGSLIQNVTSRRSLWYYLMTLCFAKRRGAKVIMYGCGIGPVTHKFDKRLVARTLNKYVDVITLREKHSLGELHEFGVTKPEIILSSDPALTLKPADNSRIDAKLTESGIDPSGKYICFALRQWEGFEEKSPCFAAAARYAHEKHGLESVFLSINHRNDGRAADIVCAGLSTPCHILHNTLDSALTIGILSRMEAVVSMRLHGLIFAAGCGVPLVGISYDPKVEAFLEYIGQETFAGLDELTEESLCSMIDSAIALSCDRRLLRENTEALIRVEGRNSEAAARLLKRGKGPA